MFEIGVVFIAHVLLAKNVGPAVSWMAKNVASLLWMEYLRKYDYQRIRKSTIIPIKILPYNFFLSETSVGAFTVAFNSQNE